MINALRILLAVQLMSVQTTSAFVAPNPSCFRSSKPLSMGISNEPTNNDVTSSRRTFFESATKSILAITTTSTTFLNPTEALAEGTEEIKRTVEPALYSILRVREATEQETRLIKSGKFKDVQRANVKLAIKFMLDNYKLNDSFIAASSFLPGQKRIQAGDVGMNTVQNLQTILEYFDASDVQNIKVGSTGLGGKETIVLSGLDATRRGIDDFLSYFPKAEVDAVVARIDAENELNFKEFDPDLGSILNPKPVKP